ncbi:MULTISPECIES: STAS domain-containing protein [unclassified Amycolatopsis]|uniref:STAS domain-containing protein n=1 Tax=unclassified Amycolatopsis TaxID=2618356 RepID=UPI0027DE65B7|nr:MULTISPECIES: STAS domain-containing protein [unclassified Amycolatopsis]HET6704098.1 STAS domain-containing protein [Amycolatopsis sp.]
MTDSHRSQLQVVRLPDGGGVRVIGDVDLSTRDIWQRALEVATATDAATRLDLSQLSFIDARGAAMLVAAAPLTLAHPPAILRRMLTLLYPAAPAQIVIEELEVS